MRVIEDKLKLSKELSSTMKDYSPWDFFLTQGFLAKKETCRTMWENFREGRPDSKVSLYFHIPYCARNKCNYCMYSSKIVENNEELDVYLNYLIAAMEYYAPVFHGFQMSNMFVGGGTPSLLNTRQFNRFLSAVNNNFNISPNGAITCEVSPSTATKDKFQAMKTHGINRISIGIQSFNEKTIMLARRRFASYEKLKKLVAHANDLQFEKVNIDLIADLPGESHEEFATSFEKALTIGSSTITVYFFRAADNVGYPVEMIEEQISAKSNEHHVKMVEMMETIAECYGYIRHKVSPLFLCQGFVNCRHTSALDEFRTDWNARDGNSCLGIGVGARSYMLDIVEYFDVGVDGTGGQSISKSLGGNIDIETTNHLVISRKKTERMRNYFLKELRKNGSVDLGFFKQLYLVDALELYEDAIGALQQLGKIEIRDGRAFFIGTSETEWGIYSKYFLTEEEIEMITTSKLFPKLYT